MADNLIFPIGFDLDKAVSDASKEWDGTYAAKLENALAKKPVSVKLKLDTKNLDSLDAVKKRLAELKIEPITPETKTAIKELAGELRTLAKALEQVQKYSVARASASPDAVRASKIRVNEERAQAQAALAAQRTAKAEDNLAAARLKAARAANTHAKATQNANNAYAEQSTYLNRLIKRMAVYWSVAQVGNFLTNVREVTAQFELQRVSLGAIIQDQNRANALFSEIKSFALKSPVSIMDFTKYTKQLAAYKIETEGLFETTKKLADVSVGLGVSMDRVILAYGQVRATGYLRASEVRQFTEMGVPIVEEIASKLSKMNGELVTAAQVMDIISKRGISFELVKDVFDDMTSAGGMFYNMQEKQGNTLFGLWAKLGDAASVMYDQIGNTESVNKGMKTAIQGLTELMKNWRAVSAAMSVEAIGVGAFLLGKKAINTGASIEAEKVAAATRNRARAQAELNTQLKIGTQADIAAARAALQKAQADENAAIAANKNVTAIGKLKTGLLSIGKSFLTGLGWGAVIALVSALVFKLADAVVNANRLKKELDGIASETGTSISRMVTNFETLANRAVKAADGSKEQRDALSELQRTYRNIIPEQELTIAKLREMKGEYTNLTIAIREYIRQQQLQKGLDTISEEYGKKVVDAERELKENLKNARFESKGGAVFALDEGQIDRIISLFKKLVQEGKSAQEALQTAFRYEGLDNLSESYTDIAAKLGLITKASREAVIDLQTDKVSYIEKAEAVTGLTKALQDQVKAENDWKKQMDDTVPTMGALTKYFEDAKKKIEEHTFAAKENTLAFDVETAKVNIDAYLEALKEALDASGVKIDLGKYITIDAQGIKNFDFAAFNNVLSGINSQFKVPLINLTKEIKEIYDGFIPSDPVARQIRAKFFYIANGVGDAGNRMRTFLWNGQGDLKNHIKSLDEAITKYEAEIYRMRVAIAQGGFLGWSAQMQFGKKLEEDEKLVRLLTELKKTEQKYVIPEKETPKTPKKPKASGGTKTDPRLGILQEMVSTLKQVNKEYDDLAKKEGNTKALKDTQKVYEATFKNMQKLAQQYKFKLPDFGVPTDTASLTKYLEAIKKAMAKLPKSQKAVLSLQVDIDKLNIDEKQKQIEEELKRLADRISRTKTAQEFYDKILSTTGDLDLAANVTMSIYGDAGTDVQAQMAEYISRLFGQVDVEMPLNIITESGTIDYTALEKYVRENKKILGNSYKELIKIAQDGQKDMAKTYEGYLKDLEVAKTYADKRIELARDTANKIAEIERSKLPQAEKDRLKAGYTERESREAAKLEYEAFKDTPLYTQMFEDLENASTSTLENMKQKLQSLQGVWGAALDPTQLKEIQSRMNEIDGQLRSRNPFKTLVASVKEYKETLKEYTVLGAQSKLTAAATAYEWTSIQKGADSKEAKAAEKTLKIEERRLKIVKKLTNEKGEQLKGQKALSKAMQIANDNEAEAYVKLNEALAEEKKAIESGSKDEISKARTKVEAAREEYNLAVETSKLVQRQAKSYKKLTDNLVSAGKTISKIGSGIAEIGQSIAGLMEAFGADGEDIQYINDMSNAINDILGGAGTILQSFQKGDIVGTITNVITAPINMVKGFVNLFSAGKVKRANKEIKRQQKLLEQLRYTYSRLEYASGKLFGTEYVNNYQQQIKNLQAQQQAYLKQAEAERSKGKKKDGDKIKEYENAARDTADEIKKMQDELVAHFTGSSKTDVARQMAKSWIEARASMSDTFAAIKGDYQDLIKNMIVEGAAAKVIENALTPVWDSMDKMLEKNDVQGAIDSLIGGMDAALSQANNGMEVLWKALEARGYDMKSLISDTDSKYSGIAKSVAEATSEEINNVAAIGNTLMYYVSPIPRMDENLAAIRSLMETGSGGATTAATTTGWTDWQQQAMDNYNAIARNTAETVAECRRSAQACESIAAQFSRIIKVKGSTTGVNTFLNS